MPELFQDGVTEALDALTPAEQYAIDARVRSEGLRYPDLDVDTLNTWIDELGPTVIAAEPSTPDDGYAELASFADDVLRLSWNGHRYRVPACSVELGELAVLVVRDNLAEASPAQNERMQQLDNATWYRAMLGGDQNSPLYDPATDVFQQLTDHGASWKLVEHFAYTAIIWAAQSEKAARDYFTRPATPPKAQPAARQPQDRKPAARKAATATTTRSRASGNTTTRQPSKAAATRGRKS